MDTADMVDREEFIDELQLAAHMMVEKVLGKSEGMEVLRMLVAAAEHGLPILDAYEEAQATVRLSDYEQRYIECYLFAYQLLESAKEQ